MPCVELRVDNAYHRIDSPDYEMVGCWFGDILKISRPNPATYLQLRVWPFMVPPDPHDWTSPGVPDWNLDSRHMETFQVSGAESAADAARKLADRLTTFAEHLEQEVT